MAATRAVGRYYCENNAAHRVFPYDGFEVLTIAPEPGKKGDVLLFSLNSARKNGTKWAWCFSCDSWVLGQRRTQHQIILDYVRRNEVRLRASGGVRQAQLALEQAVEHRRQLARERL